MTDRINALTIILEEDYREDDIDRLIDAIKMFTGVLDVKPHVASLQDSIAEARAVCDLTKKLYEVLYPTTKP